MTETLRRILWFLPVLIAGAVLLFFTLGNTRPISEKLSLPLFYNHHPKSAQSSARDAMGRVLSGDASGQRDVVVLGGAALPTILRELPGLPVAKRRIVAEALWPIARRMGLSDERSWSGTTLDSSGTSNSADEKMLFWERYNSEHSLDLRPLAVARLVRRMATRDMKLRNADLLAVDTYALPTMIEMLGGVSEQADIDRARRLVKMISHVTSGDWVIEETATRNEARRVVSEIRRDWDTNGPQWTPLNRFQLLVAHFSQTEFSKWVVRTTRELSGFDESPLIERFTRLSRTSLPLLAVALFGFLVVGPLAAAVIQVLLLKQLKWRIERFGLRAGLTAALVAQLPLLLANRRASWQELLLVSLVVGTTFSTFILHRELNDKLDWRTHHVLRSRRLHHRVLAIGRWLAPSLPTMTPLAVAEAALWVTCLEVSTKTTGLGHASLTALKSGDLYFLMALCLSLGLITGIAQVVADLFLGSRRRRLGEI